MFLVMDMAISSLNGKHLGYYEGILQLRNPNKAVLDYIAQRLAETPRVRIAKEKKVSEGRDFYFSDKRFLLNLGQKLKQRFNAYLDATVRLHSVDRTTSRNVYKLTVLIRIPTFKVGQLISLHGQQMKVMEIKRKVKLKEIKSGKKYIFNFDYVSKRVNEAAL